MGTLQGLIEAVNDLQDSVTNLTEEVDVRKNNLDLAIGSAQLAEQGAVDAKNDVIAELELVERENNTVLFDRNYLIGNASPRSGNILYDFTGARLGTVTRMLHQDSSEFTFPSQTKILGGEYNNTVVNYIWFVYSKSELVEVAISQEVV
jgi:hypothetical protein